MAKGEERGIPTNVTQQAKDMALQQQQQQQPFWPSLGNSAPQSPYIYNMPAWVLEDFCQKMDCLNDYDWMRFASYVITDQTELRKIKCMEKAGISITRELMWWWGLRLATVQQLLELLQELQLYRAAQVIMDWKSPSLTSDSVKAPLEPRQQENASLHPTGSKNRAIAGPVLKADVLPLSLPPTSMDLPHSLHSNPPVVSSVKPCSSAIPRQETVPDLLSASLLWTTGELEVATSGFSKENQISEGMFATTYKGWRNNTLYVVKRLKEQNQMQKIFRTEVQNCFRCCHPNILRLLGFSVETGFHCLIHPYMPNGSLMDRLQCQDGSEPLMWESRIKISLGLIQAIQHLHHLGIIHGNVKSSNVLLDENFVPQLGHFGLRLHPVEKKSEHAVMKTKVLQASLAYFPEDFVRHGQLTEKVDIFGCGIVLAEILTGMKAMDEGRHPLFLKDVLLDEIQAAKELSCSKERTFERLAATEICRKYQDKHAVHLPAMTAVWLATASCVCLRKKNAKMAEVHEIMEMADHQIQCQKMPEGSRYIGLSVNTPEETNDEPASPFNCSLSDRVNPNSLNCADLIQPLMRVMIPDTCSGQMLRVPCESDESSNFSWNPVEDAACQPPSNGSPNQENISPTKPLGNNPKYISDFTAKNIDCNRNESLEATASSNRMTSSHTNTENAGITCTSQAAVKEIKINDKKKKMMEQFLLYEENKINSCELFEDSV
ncbi:interleukin-1 receptor-associated kinase-like 2 isoform X2 [Rhineura floridana]|uniref:interleukin-1 receptor-associated kinase-like 2 isoform X2 n=1 Tax=Rhineura floridana TaxID=261503 RepID=UPI002AC84CB4|nr:interleukin-1 receptor-associated kinase-like 2 isoform X2 [Rhineura floridana]